MVIPIRKKLGLLALLALTSLIVASTTALARESSFLPTLGELDTTSPGAERFATSSDGALQGYSYEGNLLSGFPIFIDNAVVVSSPVMANVAGNGLNEVVVVTRTAQNVYSLNAFSSGGNEVVSALIAGDVHYDPVVLRGVAGALDSVVLSTTGGAVVRYDYSLVNGTWTSLPLFNLGEAGALTAPSEGGLAVALPGQNRIELYAETNGQWARTAQFATPSAVVEPLAEDGDKLFGVTRNGTLLGLSKATGQALAGFPVNVGQSVGAPAVGDVNQGAQGNEIVVTRSDGSAVVVAGDGVVLPDGSGVNFASLGLDTADVVARARFNLLRGFFIRIFDGNITRVATYLGRIKIPVVEGQPSIKLTVNDSVRSTGGEASFGILAPDEVGEVTIRLSNLGTDTLLLTGNPRVALTGAEAELFTLVGVPNDALVVGASTEFKVRFSQPNLGERTARMTINLNDPLVPSFVINLKAQVSTNLVNDGTMESAGVAAWRSWGTPTAKSKSTTEFSAGRQSLYLDARNRHAGVQQLGLAVLGGQAYKYSFRYKLKSGTLETNLGIHTSNGDLESKVTVLSAAPDEWRTYERYFMAPSALAGEGVIIPDFRMVLRVRGGEAFLDDVNIEAVDAIEYVSDGDMELPGLDAWKSWGRPVTLEKTSAEASSASQGIYLDTRGKNAGVQQLYLPVVAGKTYRYAFKYKLVSGKLSTTLGNRSSNVDIEGVQVNLQPTNGDWKTYERFFTPEAIGVNADGTIKDFRLVIRINNGEGYLDEVLIEEVPELAFVRDGDMEADGVDQWLPFAGPGIFQKVRDVVHSGEQALYITTPPDPIPQRRDDAGTQQLGIPVRAGQQYTFSFWYKVTGSVTPRLGIANSNQDFELVAFEELPILYTVNDWTYYERTFTVPNNYESDFRLIFRSSDGEVSADGLRYIDHEVGELWIDDVEIVEVE
ncbi:hypothetical protein CO046_03235 [Candidatus Peregrinibacteria bacterium CG_4_9_14_0_2_um_filter_53_11]|nr:MAG: hypothetical protein CO046_03235 [Candidatus Peregrinibacteria bacterium CG_4_9_14_0_2_um_filter_53_11]